MQTLEAMFRMQTLVQTVSIIWEVNFEETLGRARCHRATLDETNFFGKLESQAWTNAKMTIITVLPQLLQQGALRSGHLGDNNLQQ
jgi:hypothetical protein